MKIPLKLFHISFYNHNLPITYSPRIPSNTMDGEDNVTKRVCFSTAITGCIRAIQQDVRRDDLYFVYSPVKKTQDLSLHKPSTKEVPDVKDTREWWCLEDVELKCIGEILITKKIRGRFHWRWTKRINDSI